MSGLHRHRPPVADRLQTQLAAVRRLEPGVPLTLPRPLWKKIASLGYVLSKWTACRATALRHIAQRPDLSGVKPWLPAAGRPVGVTWEGTGLFGTLLQSEAGSATAVVPFLDPALTAHLTGLLPRFIKSRVPALSASCLEVPSHAGAPVWVALLRLRPLRDFWERMLRRHHAELLRELLPDAWLFETAPLPPQGVIPRLELHEWRELGALMSAGKSFGLVDPEDVHSARWLGHGDDPEEMDPVSVEASLAAGSAAPLVLWEQTGPPQPKTLLALYHRSSRRVALAGLVGLECKGGVWRVSSVRLGAGASQMG